jgi:hypothetical protein
METIKFWDIPKHLNELEFDGDKEDLRLHYRDSIWWYVEDEKEYEEVEDKISDFSIKRKHYEVYAWCDVSGYDYWMKEEEENYIQITVRFKKDEVPVDILPQLQQDIDQTYSYFEGFESRKNY